MTAIPLCDSMMLIVAKRGIIVSETDLVGRCGLYCGACSVYRAYKDDGEYLNRLAEHLKCPPEKVRCEGCQVLTKECWGNECKIVQCLNSKGFNFCYECPQFEDNSCEKYERLAKGYLEEDNVDIRANMARIKLGQAEAWLKESRERFKCPYCKTPCQRAPRSATTAERNSLRSFRRLKLPIKLKAELSFQVLNKWWRELSVFNCTCEFLQFPLCFHIEFSGNPAFL